MNYSTAIFLVNKDVRAVSVSYEPGPLTDNSGKRLAVAPFITYKTMDPTIKVGDFVIVPTGTRWNSTVARVEEVDLDIDFDSATQVGWVIDRVNMEAHDSLVEKETAAITTIRSAEKRRKQEELAEKLKADNPELANLAFNGPALAAPPSKD